MLGLIVVVTMNIRQTADRKTIADSPWNRQPANGNRAHRREVSIRKPRLFDINRAVVDESDSLGWGIGPTQTGSQRSRPDGGDAHSRLLFPLAALDGLKLSRQMAFCGAERHRPGLMLAKRIIPCLDVKNGRVVKGIHLESLRDAGDPLENPRWYTEAGADDDVPGY